MISSLKSMASFAMGRNPRLASLPERLDAFIPPQVDTVLILSADFELGWAWRYAKGLTDPAAEAEAYAHRARKNIPVILDLCERYGMPITWATVGHLFLDRCSMDDDGLTHPELQRLPYFENAWWSYQSGDWFEHDPASSLADNDAWYAPDLVEQILAAPAGHEIGCHTFSHIDCRDEVCPPSVLRGELLAAQQAADRFGIKLESFVFPGHTMGNFQVLKEMGYTSARTNYVNEIGYPRKDEYGLWHFPATAEIIMDPRWSERYNLYRYRKIMARSLGHRALVNFWFHPSLPTDTTANLFGGLFAEMRPMKDRIWVTTMQDYTAWLNEQASV